MNVTDIANSFQVFTKTTKALKFFPATSAILYHFLSLHDKIDFSVLGL